MGAPIRKLLNPYQSGFVPGKFISDNGLALSMILDQACSLKSPGVGLLLDQEKAYDRVHPHYLRQVMTQFQFPLQLIECVSQLFFGNQVQININGFFTSVIEQQRRLRQGDPLSPLLFNLALELFLLNILQNSSLAGLSPHISTVAPSPWLNTPDPIKCLAYADDVCLLLSHTQEPHRANLHMSNYAAVSNAKFNDNKTEVFSLAGPWDHSWNDPLHSMNITTFHHQGSLQTFRYLGFYLPYNTRQLKIIEDQLILKVQQ